MDFSDKKELSCIENANINGSGPISTIIKTTIGLGTTSLFLFAPARLNQQKNLMIENLEKQNEYLKENASLTIEVPSIYIM